MVAYLPTLSPVTEQTALFPRSFVFVREPRFFFGLIYKKIADFIFSRYDKLNNGTFFILAAYFYWFLSSICWKAWPVKTGAKVLFEKMVPRESFLIFSHKSPNYWRYTYRRIKEKNRLG